MIRIIPYLMLSLFLVSSCSSLSSEKFTKNDIEQRADQFAFSGDRARAEGNIIDAYEFYSTASDIYQIKGNPIKYLITRIKMAILDLNRGQIGTYLKIYKDAQRKNEHEDLGLDLQLAYLNARYLYKVNRCDEANSIVLDLVHKYYDNEEKRAYYRFFYAKKNISYLTVNDIRNLESDYYTVYERYEDGSIENIEVLNFTTIVLAKVFLQYKYTEKALQQIERADKLYMALELSAKRDEIYELYIKYYQLTQDRKQEKYYKGLLKRLLMLQKKYVY